MTTINQSRHLQLHHSDMDAGALRKAHDRGVIGRMTGELMREWEMRARLNVLVRRGEIAPEVVLVPEGHTLHAYYVRLKPARSRWTLPAWLSLAGAGTLSAVVWLVWESRYVFLSLAIAIVSIIVITGVIGMIASVATGCSCVIHGPRCKG